MLKLLLLLLPVCLLSCDFIKNLMTNSSAGKQESALEEKKTVTKGGQVDFLEKNKTQAGVKATASGLQYKVIKEGQGKSPSSSDQVEVHYKGTLISGEEFDSSYKRGRPAQFRLNQVIAGWTEGLQLMKEGAEFEFYIPSELAYGDRNLPGIPANSTLIFKVELIKVLP